jgi:O-antigen/teichoic acid export membrane protein
LLRSGLPFFGATATNLVSLQFDTILVVSLFSTEAAGIYAVAGVFATGQSSLGEALGMTSFGVLSNECDSKRRSTMIREIFRQSSLISFGAGLGIAGLIPFLLVPMFGAPYSPAIRPAVILALSASLASAANILNQALRGAGRPHSGLISQLLGTGVLALGALISFRQFGLVGVAIAVGLSAGAQLLSMIGFAAQWLKMSPVEFWPFGAENVRQFFQQIASLRLRVSRSVA